jgi:hypothetical protein
MVIVHLTEYGSGPSPNPNPKAVEPGVGTGKGRHRKKLELPKTLPDFEKAIVDQPDEHFGLFDGKGAQVLVKDGNALHVNFKDAEVLAADKNERPLTSIHNHPRDGIPSPDDVKLALDMGVDHMQVIGRRRDGTGEVYRYTVDLPQGNKDYYNNRSFYNGLENQSTLVHEEVRDQSLVFHRKYGSGTPEYEKAYHKMWNEVGDAWFQRVANDYGISYRKELVKW